MQNQAASCHLSHTVPKSSYSCPDPSPPPPPTLCKQTPNHLHSYVPDVQTISIFHVSPHQQHNWYQEGCINPHCAFCPSRTPPHIHLTIIRSVLSKLLRSSAFIAQVSVPYIKTLWTQALFVQIIGWIECFQVWGVDDIGSWANHRSLNNAGIYGEYRW